MLQMRETGVNQSESYSFGDSDWYPPFTTDKRQLFRSCQREYGRCAGFVYLDAESGAIPVGWLFEKRVQYQDSPDFFTLETWVEFRIDESISNSLNQRGDLLVSHHVVSATYFDLRQWRTIVKD